MDFRTAFEPFQLGNQNLRNRFIKTATYEGMTPNSMPSSDLIEHHRRIAEGGVAMTESDLQQVLDDFERAAELSMEAGFDAVEVHLGHGYLLSQFLSPWSNRRKDKYGGSLENRLRFPLQVIERVRKAVGDNPILAKINVSDGFKGGLEPVEAMVISKALDQHVDAIVTSGGFTSKSPLFLLRGGRPLRDMIEVEESLAQKLALLLFGPFVVKAFPFEENFFQNTAARIRGEVNTAVCLVGGVSSRAGVESAMKDGIQLLALGRALIHDPDFVRKLEQETITKSGCVHCNRCIAEMDRSGVRCVLDDAPGFRI